MTDDKNVSVPVERLIYLIRGLRVMLDQDLARLYGVQTGILKRAVRRNGDRFPSDFMFELSADEYRSLRCQDGILKRGKHVKYLPFAFTEQGVAMLSSVLTSKHAVHVNVAIMRGFVRFREALSAHKELAIKLAELEKKIVHHDEAIQSLFRAIRDLMRAPVQVKKQIGFHR